MRERTAFGCDFCNMVSMNKCSARRHEAKCYRDPKNRACYTCEYADGWSCSHPTIGSDEYMRRTNCSEHKLKEPTP